MDPLQYFRKFNCAEAVLLALSDATGIPGECDCIPRVATGFGGGMQTGAVCGAVSGAIIAFGAHYGRMKAEEVEKRDRVYALVKEFTQQFKKNHHTIVCQELLGVNVQTEEGRKKYKENNLHIRCQNYVVTAFQIARTLLSAG
jgi:C_GCAxxG_C_C family probable redox protein